MSIKGVWKAKHGLTFMQTREVELYRQMEAMRDREERALFQSWEDEPRLVAALQAERSAWVADIEKRITDGWRPSPEQWVSIEQKLNSFSQRHQAIVDPHGIMPLVDAVVAMERLRKKAEAHPSFWPWSF